MSTIEISCEAEIHSAAARIFDLITDLRGQEAWLSKSASFRGTTEVSENPVSLGTTYVEREPMGVRRGEVTEFERPAKITFHHPMKMRAGLGTMDIVLRYTLTSEGDSTLVRRAATVTLPWQLRLIRPIVVRTFRRESERTLAALKAHGDSL